MRVHATISEARWHRARLTSANKIDVRQNTCIVYERSGSSLQNKAHKMDSLEALREREEARERIHPFFYFVIVFTALHALVASGLLVRQRAKFPISGHNVPLTIIVGVRCRSIIRLTACVILWCFTQ